MSKLKTGLGIAMVCILLMACSSLDIFNLNANSAMFKDAYMAYCAAIRWNQMGIAAGFIDVEERERFFAIDSSLTSYRFTDYDIQSVNFYPKTNSGELIVRYHVHHESTLIQRTVFENQSWFYDEDRKVFRLKSDLPERLEMVMNAAPSLEEEINPELEKLEGKALEESIGE